MSAIWIGALVALFLWWFGTGAVLLADRLPRARRGRGLIGATFLTVMAIGLIVDRADDQSILGALVGFTGALVIWGWHELSFLSGALTGPRRGPCPEGATGWRRFRYATETLIYHEIAIALTAIALGWGLWEAGNQVALWTYMVLWCMRLSAKLNIFLGAPNVAEEFLPDDLNYLTTYFGARAFNLLFPVSVALGLGATWWMADNALSAGGDAFAATAWALLAMLTALGTLEHGFLVTKVKEWKIWRWYLRADAAR